MTVSATHSCIIRSLAPLIRVVSCHRTHRGRGRHPPTPPLARRCIFFTREQFSF